MRSTTSTYKQIISSGATRNFLVRIDMTLADDTQLTITDANIMQGSFKILSASSSDSSFDIGSAIIGKCQFTLENINDTYTQYDFFNATAVVWLKLVGDSEYHRMGFYTVDEPIFAGSLVQLEMLDNMWKFDVPLAEATLSYPCNILTAVNRICTNCGVTLATQQFHGYDYTLTQAPEQDMNCREFLQYVAMIGCNFCYIDSTGALNLRWYDVGAYSRETELDGGTFNTNTTPYSDGDTADGGNFTDYTGGTDYDGGTFIGLNRTNYFTRLMTRNIGTDDIVVTGVKFTIDDTDFSIGTDGYVLTLENPLVNTSNVSAVLNLIWEVLQGFTFRTYSVTALPDLAPEVGDFVAVSYKGNMVYSYLTNFTFTPSLLTASLGAITPNRVLTKRYSKNVQASVEVARKQSDERISAYDVAVQAMNALSINAMGAYQDYEEASTGGRIYYLSNKPLSKTAQGEIRLTENSTAFKATGDGLFVSVYNPSVPGSGSIYPSQRTWANGYDAQTGTLVVNVLEAIGLKADWVVTGLLRDQNNYNYWNLNTGEFRLASTTTVGGQTVDAIAQGKADAAQQAAITTSAQALATAVGVINNDIDDLQSQIDGNITTWFYNYAPTTSNAPASDWTTLDDKINHIGDLFYDSTTGYAYRWQVKSTAQDPTHPTVNDFEWVQLSDSDISEALSKAQTAQDTADHKKRVFITQPVPPYDEGDLWCVGTSGDILTCVNGSTTAYDPDDWEKLNKYTDDTLAKAQYGICSTVANETAKVVSLPNFVLYNGARISVSFTNKNTASSVTLNVNNTGAKPVYARGAALSSAYYWNDNSLCQFVYDGTNWVMQVQDQKEIFDSLTNGGTTQGIYLAVDPADNIQKLYINATYIKSGEIDANLITAGEINASLIKAGTIADKAGKFSLDMNSGALTMNSGMFKGQINVNNNFLVDSSGNMTAQSGIIGNLTLGSGALYAYGVVNFASNKSVTASKRGTVTMQIAKFTPSQIGVASNFNLIFQYYVHTTYSRDMYVKLQYLSGSTWYDVESQYISPYNYSWTTVNFSTTFNYTSTTRYRVVVQFASTSGSYRQRIICNLYTSSVVKTAISADGFVGKINSNSADIGGIHFESGAISTDNGQTLLEENDGFYISNINLSFYDSGTPLLLYSQYGNLNTGYAGLLANGNFVAWQDDNNYVVIENDGYVTYMKNGTSHSSIPWSGSDRRIKEDITILDMEMSKKLIDATEVYKFKYINDKGHHYGVMAQDVRQVLDELGETDSQLEYEMEDTEVPGSINVAYQEYIPLLINYVKDLRAEINELKEEIKSLKEEK